MNLFYRIFALYVFLSAVGIPLMEEAVCCETPVVEMGGAHEGPDHCQAPCPPFENCVSCTGALILPPFSGDDSPTVLLKSKISGLPDRQISEVPHPLLKPPKIRNLFPN